MLCSNLCHLLSWFSICAFPPTPLLLLSVRGCVFRCLLFPHSLFFGLIHNTLFSTRSMLIPGWQMLSIKAILSILVPPPHTHSPKKLEEEISLSQSSKCIFHSASLFTYEDRSPSYYLQMTILCSGKVI